MLFHRKIHRPGLTTVYTTQGLLQAELIKSKLESAGIPALLDYESAGPVLGITVDGLGEVRVMVPEALAEDAQAVLAAEPEEGWEDEATEGFNESMTNEQ
ncbi:MAG: DUF2007 domain-containing protein [Anaerolineae bacterium]|jgi:hypothetical protein|nr:DUF2007 domain-containing protein [Anaerolineae bacterium]MDH7475103.1 DUF2007 domain-containing protein [Anaerolineae bacterium]